jgi:hypothetical protein
MDDFSSYSIAFTNAAGTRIELPTMVSYLDPKPAVIETETDYIVRTISMDDFYRSGDSFYVEYFISPGAYIMLKDSWHSKPRVACHSEAYCVHDDADDYYISQFYSGAELRPIASIKDSQVEVNLYDFESAWNSGHTYDAMVTIYHHSIDAETFMDTVDWEHTKWDPDFIRALFCLLDDQEFSSFIELREFITDYVELSYDEVKIDIKDLDEDQFMTNLQDVCNTRPDWSYFTLDKFDHSAVVYSIAGTGPECRWDTSHGVGVWCLCDEEVKQLEEFFEQNPDIDKYEHVAKICNHDLKLISDCNPMYTVYDYIVSKKDFEQETEACTSGFYEEKDTLLPEIEKLSSCYTNVVKVITDYELKEIEAKNEYGY